MLPNKSVGSSIILNIGYADAVMVYRLYAKDFFEDGTPKYYHNKTYPIDIHCPAQLFATLYSLKKFNKHKKLAERVMNWTIRNMQDKKGLFLLSNKERQKFQNFIHALAKCLDVLWYELLFFKSIRE